ncbi:MAG TPA: hypothetical protein DCS66_23005 [Flavobacteriaceae bacterium]|nr:hypothetical protein [Flavobacteriaceae bacterium]
MNNETNIKINEAKKIIKCCGFTIFYSSKESAIDILNEVFFENTYQFNISDNDSIIIDAGSNIGISSLFFRRNYSNKIIAFEPDPNAFNLLKKNIKENNVGNIHIENIALSQTTEDIDFYGEFINDESDSRGNSIFKSWGLQRSHSSKIKVKSDKLSNFIDNKKQHFIKIDIEGAEHLVIADLENSNKLNYIQEVIIEVHEQDKLKDNTRLRYIIKILEKNKFQCNISKKEYNLPEPIQEWVNKTAPEAVN